MHPCRNQSGAVLPVSLFILLIVTLVAISSMDTSNTGLRVAFNQQAQMQAQMVANRRIEQVMSSAQWFTPEALGGTIWDSASPNQTISNTVEGFNVTVTKPVCIGSIPASGYSVQVTFPPEDVFWEFDVIVDDPVTGARMVTTQGVKMRMINGICYHPPYTI